MLRADECLEHHDELLSDYCEDLKPVGVLERRQVELTLRCDIDIDRQLRIIAHHLNPPQEIENSGAEMVAEWHQQALLHPNAIHDSDEEEVAPPIETFFKMQDCRRGREVPDAEVVDGKDF